MRSFGIGMQMKNRSVCDGVDHIYRQWRDAIGGKIKTIFGAGHIPSLLLVPFCTTSKNTIVKATQQL